MFAHDRLRRDCDRDILMDDLIRMYVSVCVWGGLFFEWIYDFYQLKCFLYAVGRADGARSVQRCRVWKIYFLWLNLDYARKAFQTGW